VSEYKPLNIVFPLPPCPLAAAIMERDYLWKLWTFHINREWDADRRAANYARSSDLAARQAAHSLLVIERHLRAVAPKPAKKRVPRPPNGKGRGK
jgi:hypothetical protein